MPAKRARGAGTAKARLRERGGGEQRGEAEAGEEKRVLRDVGYGREEVGDELREGFGDGFEEGAVLAAVFRVEVGNGVCDGVLEYNGGAVVERVGAGGGRLDP